MLMLRQYRIRKVCFPQKRLSMLGRGGQGGFIYNFPRNKRQIKPLAEDDSNRDLHDAPTKGTITFDNYNKSLVNFDNTDKFESKYNFRFEDQGADTDTHSTSGVNNTISDTLAAPRKGLYDQEHKPDSHPKENYKDTVTSFTALLTGHAPRRTVFWIFRSWSCLYGIGKLCHSQLHRFLIQLWYQTVHQ